MTNSHHKHETPTLNAALAAFVRDQKLSLQYLEMAEKWFSPLISYILTDLKNTQNQVLIVGINGCQGSGKSTLAHYLRTILDVEHHIGAEVLSIDDFYLSRQQRQHLANTVHPLLLTRGVPGTHDIGLLIDVIEKLSNKDSESIPLPTFNKAIDDIDTNAGRISQPASRVIILEGWCLGAAAQTPTELQGPINELESKEDQNGVWRNYVNDQLKGNYSKLFGHIETWIMLKAPSFYWVFDWRKEQENKLTDVVNKSKHANIMNDDKLRQFIAHYQRITESCLKNLPQRVQHLFEFNEQREITQYRKPIPSQQL